MENEKNTQLFMGLCSSLVSQAWMQLGKIKNPVTDKVETNLEGASLTIDMISMLKEKTKGNISDEEKKIIDQSINELRMNFILLEKESKNTTDKKAKKKDDEKDASDKENK